jgi:hypothetical protein
MGVRAGLQIINRSREIMNHRTLRLLTAIPLTLAFAAPDAWALSKSPIDVGDPAPVVTVVKPPPPPPVCADPTLAQCQDPAYLSSTCAAQKQQKCMDLVGPLYSASVQSLSATSSVLVDNGANKLLKTGRAFAGTAMPARKLSAGVLSFQSS